MNKALHQSILSEFFAALKCAVNSDGEKPEWFRPSLALCSTLHRYLKYHHYDDYHIRSGTAVHFSEMLDTLYGCSVFPFGIGIYVDVVDFYDPDCGISQSNKARLHFINNFQSKLEKFNGRTN